MKNFWFLLLFVSSASLGQSVQIMVSDIREDRRLNQKDAQVEIHLKVNGIVVDEHRKLKMGKILRATDNLGNDLKQVQGYFDEGYTDRNEVRVRLQAPLRNAKEITKVEGTLLYFTPTVENRGLVKSALVYNKNLLREKDVQLILIDEAAFKKMKEEDEAKFNKELEKLKKEGGEVAGMIGEMKGFFESLFSMGSEGPILHFFLDDPNKRIVDIQVLNEKGEEVDSGYSSSGNHREVMLSGPLQSSWTLRIYVENEKSKKELPFTLGAVFLP
jgi:hypothetical protein